MTVDQDKHVGGAEDSNYAIKKNEILRRSYFFSKTLAV